MRPIGLFLMAATVTNACSDIFELRFEGLSRVFPTAEFSASEHRQATHSLCVLPDSKTDVVVALI